MERYLRRAFLGQKQFSIEGLDVMVPMLDEAIELAAEAGAHEVVIGMAHRGRLNVLAHTRRPALRGDPARVRGRADDRRRRLDPEGGTGDVKYHLGAEGVAHDAARARSPSRCAPTRATWRRSTRSSRAARAPSRPTARRAPASTTRRVALPILIHGDAAFAGQGVVAETLNLEGLAGYTTGGTLHLIANNQVGFTTDPAEGRSTRYSSDLAKGFDVPIIHVNADDPEAAISAIRLALAFRQPVRARRRRRPRRLPPLRPQRAGRARVHAAADGADDREPPDRPRAVRRAARRGGRRPEPKRRSSSTRASRRELRAAHERLKESIAERRPSREVPRSRRDRRRGARASRPTGCAS